MISLKIPDIKVLEDLLFKGSIGFAGLAVFTLVYLFLNLPYGHIIVPALLVLLGLTVVGAVMGVMFGLIYFQKKSEENKPGS
jgi:hypothetical protein